MSFGVVYVLITRTHKSHPLYILADRLVVYMNLAYENRRGNDWGDD